MATEAIKSASITNYDASPPVRPTAGAAGGGGRLVFADESAAFADLVTAGSTYRMVRVPSNAVIKRLRACVDTAVTTFTVDIGVYYDSSTARAADLRSDVIVADLFGSAVALAAVVVPTEYTMESTVLTVADMFLPLWDAAGLTSDPGGNLDIVLTNTATNSGAGTAYLSVEYVVPGA